MIGRARAAAEARQAARARARAGGGACGPRRAAGFLSLRCRGCSVAARRGAGRSPSELWILKIFSQNPPIRPSAKNRPPTLRKGDPHVFILCGGTARAPPPRSWKPPEPGLARGLRPERRGREGEWDGSRGRGQGQWPGGGRRLQPRQICPWDRLLPLHVRLARFLSPSSEAALPTLLVLESLKDT